MAMGEWVSVQSSREPSARELAVERRAHRDRVGGGAGGARTRLRAEGAASARGAQGRRAADGRSGDRARHARTRGARDRPDELGGSPWVAAGASFALFVLGAILPVLPFFFLSGRGGGRRRARRSPPSRSSASARRSRSSPVAAPSSPGRASSPSERRRSLRPTGSAWSSARPSAERHGPRRRCPALRPATRAPPAAPPRRRRAPRGHGAASSGRSAWPGRSCRAPWVPGRRAGPARSRAALRPIAR